MFSGFHSSINNLSTFCEVSHYIHWKSKFVRYRCRVGGLFKVRMQLLKQESTTCPNTNRVLRCRTSQPGRLLRGHLRPILVVGHLKKATLSEWKSKRSQKLSKKMSKCANFTITAAKMKPALCRKYHHLSTPSKTAWYQKRKKHKTDILHPEHLVCCLNLSKVFEEPWKWPFWRWALPAENDWRSCPAWPATNLKSQQKMLQPIGNCSFVVFCWVFCEKFGC